MKHFNLTSWILIAGVSLLMPLSAAAADDQQRKPTHPGIASPSENPTPALATPVYKPPPRGTPGGRVAGGSRGPGDALPMLFVLAPDHTGLTADEQPSLYWYLSKATTYPVEFTITEEQAVHPLFETRLSAPLQPGVHRVRLADYGVRLARGVLYRWYVALVVDPDHRAKDIIAGGALELIELPEALHGKLARAGTAEVPHLAAEAGLWYDAVMAISDLIAAAPQQRGLWQQRAALLEQVGLPDIAAHDLRHSRAD